MAAGDALKRLRNRMLFGSYLNHIFFFMKNAFVVLVELVVLALTSKNLRRKSQLHFMQCTVELLTSANESDHREAQALFQDWTSARGRLLTEITAKVSYFQQLPWKLLQLAHPDHSTAMLGAQQCV